MASHADSDREGAGRHGSNDPATSQNRMSSSRKEAERQKGSVTPAKSEQARELREKEDRRSERD